MEPLEGRALDPIPATAPDADADATPPAQSVGAAPDGAAPAFADGVARQLEPAWITVERTSGLIFTGVIALGLLVGYALLALNNRNHPLALVVVGLAALVLATSLLALAALWPRWEYARAGYRVLPDRIEAWRGLVWRRSTSVPISRVQYTDVKQGPLMRRHGIATLAIHTAGTLGAEVELPGLPPELATAIRDWLVRQTGSDAV